MESNRDIDDEMLGRWLAGELSDEERISFEASVAFKSYDAIARYSSELETPEFNSEEIYGNIDSKIAAQKGKVVKVSFFKKLAVAASVLILIGVGALYMFGSHPVEDTVVLTVQGDQKMIYLPDDSEISLNISSSISYNEGSWDEAREIELKGEAFFKVKKGKRFIVKTKQGDIEVLGTSFNIRNRNGITEVSCFTGKVKVTDLKGGTRILKRREATRIINGKIDDQDFDHNRLDPAWIIGHSEFDNVPLEIVIEEIENFFSVQIDCKVDISNRTFVGQFPHDELLDALQLVFDPMQLEYTIKNDTLIVVK